MAKKKTTKKKATRKKAQKKQETSSIGAVYIILAVLVIGTSFGTGYMVGKNAGSGSTGSLTVIEYSDFECPFCSRAVDTIKQVKANYPNVEVEYKHFPLETIHPNALNAAIASECVREAGGDDAFWDYHDVLFENQQALGATQLKQYASDMGYDISSCLDNKETEAKVRADMDEARARGVTGTPSFWIGDELIVGAQPYDVVAAKIDEKLSGDVAPAPEPTPTEPTPAPVVDMEAGTYGLGDPNAPVLVVEFTDFQCPFCQRAHDQTFPELKSTYIDTGKVYYSVRHYPLPFHQDAQKASEGAECAGSIGGADAFWDYTDVLFANQQALGTSQLKQYAADLGLDQAAFDSCLDDGDFAQKVQDDLSVGQEAGVRGTPSFFINGKSLVGAQPFTAFQAAIDAELE